MTQTAAPIIGSTVYVASEMRYYGKMCIESADHTAQTVVVTDGKRRGRASFDQIFYKAADAKALATQTIWRS